MTLADTASRNQLIAEIEGRLSALRRAYIGKQADLLASALEAELSRLRNEPAPQQFGEDACAEWMHELAAVGYHPSTAEQQAFSSGYAAALQAALALPSRTGLEEAAKWHEEQAQELSGLNDGLESIDKPGLRIMWHRDCAQYFRSRQKSEGKKPDVDA